MQRNDDERTMPCRTRSPSTPTSSGARPPTTSYRREGPYRNAAGNWASTPRWSTNGRHAPARALRRARPQGRGPRAARGQKAHPRARDGERVFEKKSRPSSPKTRRSRALPPHAGGEGRIPREADGPCARREPLGLLLVARERLPGGRLGRRARRRHARVAGIGPQVRLPVRARDAAAGVLAPDALQGC